MTPSFLLSYGALWVLVLFQSVLLVGLVHSVYRLREDAGRGDDARLANTDPIGQVAPRLSGIDLLGNVIDSLEWPPQLTGILFVSPTCKSCDLLLGGVEYEALKAKTSNRLYIVCRSGHDDCLGLAQRHGVDAPVLVDARGDLTQTFGVSRLPTAVLVNADGRIQSYGQPQRFDGPPDTSIEAAQSRPLGAQ